MAESYFAEKADVPDERRLPEALGESLPLWEAAVALAGGTGEWKFYTKAAGWVYPVKAGKRTLFYMMPKTGHFKLTFVYGERAVEAAKTAGLPGPVLKALLDSRPYMEGRSAALEVRRQADFETFEKLLKLKLEN